MLINKICPVCNSIFKTAYKHKIYCNTHCRKIHHKQIYYNKNRTIEDISNENIPIIIRQFICKKCKKEVLVKSQKDRRTVFCSPHCEKLYWKHKKIETNDNDNDFSDLLNKHL